MKALKHVATWMRHQLDERPELYQDEAADAIRKQFGEQFTYENENGNWAIDRKVLPEFLRFTKDTVVWVRGERMWRTRERFDASGRQAD